MIKTVTMFSLGMLLTGAIVGGTAAEAFYPAYDPTNTGNWWLNPAVSDEFEGAQLDESKWHVQGTDGFYYSNFKGRAPSQFSTDNVRIEDGKLKIESRWEPDFDFIDTPGQGGLAYENITTAAVISKELYHYGYMEIKAKAADASVTSSFWMTGHHTELDVFEFLGNPKQSHKAHLKKELWSSIHDWSPQGGGVSTWTDRLQLPWEVAQDFHVYGIEWNPEYLTFHADGQLVRHITKAQVEAAYPGGWTIDSELRTWVDSETFWWHGLPVAGDLSADYEIEYLRVWHDAGLPGDYNDSGSVEQGDLDLVLQNWGQGHADVPGGWGNQRPLDGIVDQAELDGVLQAWGSAAAPDLGGSHVPEPASALLALGSFLLSRRART